MVRTYSDGMILSGQMLNVDYKELFGRFSLHANGGVNIANSGEITLAWTNTLNVPLKVVSLDAMVIGGGGTTGKWEWAATGPVKFGSIWSGLYIPVGSSFSFSTTAPNTAPMGYIILMESGGTLLNGQ